MNVDEQKRQKRFGRLRPPSFSGTELEYAQDLLDICQRILRTTGILETSGFSFTTLKLTGTAFRWWETYERSRPVGVAPLSWHEFSVLFLEKFVPQTRRSCAGSSRIYVRRTFWLVTTEREKIKRFINGLNQQFHFVMTLGNATGAKFDEVVDSARRLEMVHI
ncbi:uncharacterized protein [Nicotiana tomentosiformis]|uniref:uncharacterized protein n=1 Tax=Nicotiana tomentosiformis TaxID=4098 RepID=UPI00388CD5F0